VPNEKAWKDFLAKKSEKKKNEESISALTLTRAAVDARILTGHPAWDKYLSYLQAMLEESMKVLENLETLLLSPATLEPQDLAVAKTRYLCVNERVETLRLAMKLPEEIKKLTSEQS
jgi:hypothetical protein